MSKRRGTPRHRPRRAELAATPAVINVPSDSVAAALVDIQIQLVRMDGRFDGIDRRLDGIDRRLDGIDVRLDGIDVRLDGVDARIKEVSAEVHILTRWKERALGVILASGVFAAMLAFAVNVAKMFVSSPS
ncbi:hypothetical protein ACVWWJ_003435 [Luteibacter sp. HA06]